MKMFLYYLLIITTFLLSSCTVIDDLSERVEELEVRVASVEKLLSAYEMNLSITSIQEVSGGYSISFTDGSNIIIYHGTDGKDGVDGTDGKDGKDGKDGVDGTDGKDGKDGVDGDTYIQSVVIDDVRVIFTLSDGKVFSIPLYYALSIQFNTDDLVVMTPESIVDINYTVTSMLQDVQVEALSSGDLEAVVIPDESDAMSGIIRVIAQGDEIKEHSRVVVLVSNGEKVIMRTLKFEEQVIEILYDNVSYQSPEAHETAVSYLSNVECEVVIPEDAKNWINVVPETKDVEHGYITLQLTENTGTMRSAVVVLQNKDASMQLEYKIVQYPYDDYQIELERETLVAIYNALGGAAWTNNDNWCSDKPVGEWEGVSTNEKGHVYWLGLSDNNMVGYIPDDIKNLVYMETFSCDGLTNDYKEIPAVFADMPRLKTLSIGCPKITSFPDDLSIFSNLNSLGIDCTNISQFPDDLSPFKHLENLSLSHNLFDCELPESIGELTNLKSLTLQGGRKFRGQGALRGEIPASIGNLTNLETLFLDWNNFTGEIPESFGNLTDLKILVMNANYISGKIPESVMKTDWWPQYWANVIDQRGNISREGLIIPGPRFNVETIDGDRIDYGIYAENEYTILYHYYDWCPFSDEFTPKLVKLYEQYKDKGLEVIAFSLDECDSENYHKLYAERFNTLWTYIMIGSRNTNRDFESYIGYSPAWGVIDKNGNTVFNYMLDDRNDLEAFLMERLGAPSDIETPEHYVSSDYSEDGTVVVLQTAKVGNGIDVVLMGDGYSDRQISDGTYRADMEIMHNSLLAEEPFKSFRDMFNVYYVNVVSATEGYSYNDTALEGWFGAGTHVGGDDEKCFEYALNAIEENRMDEALIVVAMNSNYYAGTCYMYYPESATGTYGSGPSISYFPRGEDAETFAQLLQHEANGHGFAKLADEYVSTDTGVVPSEYVSEIQTQQNDWGWWKNVDFTSDPDQVLWSYFLDDYRYAADGLGVFEGGLTYFSGVWRPTENSIMRYNTGGFNAPSREAIYYRIHKLAYGDSWEYDYEDFVEYDAVNRSSTASAPQKSRRNYVEKPLEPTAVPVVVGRSWRE